MCAARHALHDQNLEKEVHQISPSLVNLPGDCQLPKSHCKVSLCARMLQASQNAEAQAGIEFATLPLVLSTLLVLVDVRPFHFKSASFSLFLTIMTTSTIWGFLIVFMV